MNFTDFKKQFLRNVKQTIFQNKSDVLYPNPSFENLLINNFKFDGDNLIYSNETKKLHLSYRNEDKFINTDYLLLFHLFGFNISLEAIDIILASDDWAMSQLNYYDGIEYGLKKYLTTICSYYSDYSLAKFNFSADILEKFACKSKFFNHTTVDGNATFFNPFGPKFDRTENWFLEIDYAVKYDKNFVISHHFNITELKNS